MLHHYKMPVFILSVKYIYASTLIMIYLQLLKKDEEGNYNKAAITACKQIVDCLVENVLRIEEKSVGKSVFNLYYLLFIKLIQQLYPSDFSMNCTF